ncbi:ATP-dependent Clp protease proteolytic subunit [Haemophilus sp. oral taxon 851]|uniref:ATP-dependent Clp protease proteolytic subunit n=1 Tax=Haemophilus sp. oral taxon 851 TaxID=762964 RepID=UPI0012EAFADE|nr:ATP-dependent Clp protease proteolytic subunit [Haemophilus sp. oral taxon 851]
MKNWLKELFLSLTISPLAFSAEMPVQAFQDGTVVMGIYGDIEGNDGQQFINIIESWRVSGHPIQIIDLHSGGGSVISGYQIADYIMRHRIQTVVRGNSECASSCFNIFIAGQPRVSEPNSKIGVHRISSGSNDTHLARSLSIDMSAYYKSMRIPNNIRLAMLETPPERMYWLTAKDLKDVSDYQLNYSEAEKVFSDGGLKESKSMITNNSKAQSRSLNREAISLIRNNNFALAISKLEQAKSLNPADSEILGNLGYAYYMSEDLKNAQINFTASLKITPKRGATWGNLADLLAYTGQIDWSVQAWINYYNYSKNKQAAQGQFDYVLENYPNTNNAIAVKQAMAQLGLY